MAKEDNLSKIERKEVVKEINKKIHTSVIEKAKVLRNEFRKQTATAIITAFGLIIAFSWKDVINEFVNKLAIVKEYGLIISAIILTFICVLGILAITKWVNPVGNK